MIINTSINTSINKIQIPNRDAVHGDTVTPKEILQRSYSKHVGKTILIDNTPRLVTSVDITTEWININLQEVKLKQYSL